MTQTTLKIRLYGDPCLTTPSQAVADVGASERLLIQSMIRTMYAHKGIGLAAPQIGINKKIFVADVGDGPIAVVNPKIIKKSGSSKMEEGCLSIPGVLVMIERPEKILVEFKDENNEKVRLELGELLARVFQHENDHLEGKLILDYADEAERGKLIEAFAKAVEEGKK
jgi:peptide deformylase